jgi:hypothetical protein
LSERLRKPAGFNGFKFPQRPYNPNLKFFSTAKAYLPIAIFPSKNAKSSEVSRSQVFLKGLPLNSVHIKGVKLAGHDWPSGNLHTLKAPAGEVFTSLIRQEETQQGAMFLVTVGHVAALSGSGFVASTVRRAARW